MNKLLGAAVIALLFSAPVMASATTISQPAARPASAPYINGHGLGHWTATLNYQDALHLSPSVQLSHSPNAHPLNGGLDSVAFLLNGT